MTTQTNKPSSSDSDKPKRKRQIPTAACMQCQLHHRACGVERYFFHTFYQINNFYFRPCYSCVRFELECVEGKQRTKVNKKRSPKRSTSKSSPSPPGNPHSRCLFHINVCLVSSSPSPDYEEPEINIPPQAEPLVPSQTLTLDSSSLMQISPLASRINSPPTLMPGSTALSPLLYDSLEDTESQFAFIEEILFPSFSGSDTSHV